jgi:uncharacterized repeat protein (TIGR01451 family)
MPKTTLTKAKKLILPALLLSLFLTSAIVFAENEKGKDQNQEKGQSQESRLVFSHAECAEEQGQIEIHFVVNHLNEEPSDFGSVNYTVNNQDFTAEFDKLTGKTAHYASYISYTDSNYDFSSANVTIDGETFSLHNPQNKELSCQTEVDLSIAKTVDNATPIVETTITYTITVQNNSNFGVENVIAEDQLPAGITYQSHTASHGDYNQETGAWNIGTLDGSSSATLDIIVSIDESSAGMNIENVGSIVSSDTPDSSLENNYDDALVTVSFIGPTAHNDSYSVDEDKILHIEPLGPLSNDEHIEQGVITAVIVNNPSHGEVNFHDNGEFTYVPEENYNGMDSFVYEVCVDHSLCDAATVSITVNPVNDAPVANGDLATTVEGQSVTINVIHDDRDIDNNLDSSSVAIVSSPANGTASPNADGTVIYTPNDSFSGTDIFTYKVCDTENLCSEVSAEVSVLVLSEEGASLIAVNDSVVLDEDSFVTIPVLANDIYTGEGDLYIDSILESPTHGEIVVNEDGTLTYTPKQDFFGTDYFTYVVCDNLDPQLCAESEESVITVNMVNDAPVANDDTVTVEENETIVIHVTHDDVDVDNNLDETSLLLESLPSSGTAEANIDGTISYAPNQNYIGNDELMYKICDEEDMCDTAKVMISVTEAVHVPVANIDYVTVIGGDSIEINVLENDESDSGNLYVDRILDEPLFGTAVLNSDDTLTYTPNEGYYGEDEIVYIVCSEPNVCSQSEVFITISEINHAPEARDDVAGTFKNEAITIDVIHDDVDVDNNIDPTSVSITSQPSSGTVSVNDDGSVTYYPNQDFTGIDNFTYSVCDLEGLCSEADATVEVAVVEKPAPSSSGGGGGGSSITAPTGMDDEVSVFHHETLVVDVLENDKPANNSYLFVSRISYDPLYGTVEINEDNTISYFSDGEYVGIDRFDYVVCDSRVEGLCSDAEVVITVSEDDTAPIAQDDFISVHENGSAEINVLIDDFDLEKNIDTETLKIISFPENGTAEIKDGGVIAYTANEGFVGLDELEYLICDTEKECDTASVTLNVFADKSEAEKIKGYEKIENYGKKSGYCDEYLKKYIKYGAKNDYNEVKKLQSFLLFYEDSMNAYITGIYDEPHRDIVYKFQTKYAEDILKPWGLTKPTGYVYETTKKKINELYCSASCHPYLTDFIKYGAQNDPDQVKKLQIFLKNYEGHKNIAETGVYDQTTYQAVLDFQKKYSKDILDYWGISQSTGRVYKTTVKKINELYCAMKNE